MSYSRNRRSSFQERAGEGRLVMEAKSWAGGLDLDRYKLIEWATEVTETSVFLSSSADILQRKA